MGSAAVAGRLARREIVRRPWRSLLVLLLVVLPVMAVGSIAVILRTTVGVPEQMAGPSEWGDLFLPAAELEGFGGTEADRVDPVALGLPAGSEVRPVRTNDLPLRTTASGWIDALVTDLALGDPLFDGPAEVLVGRVPTGADEVLLSAGLARRLGLGIDDRLALRRPEVDVVVVGIAEFPDDLRREVVVVARSTEAPAAELLAGSRRSVVVDLPPAAEDDPAILEPFVAAGAWTPVDPAEWHADPADPQDAVAWTWVGAVVAFVVMGVVIAAAFAVSARRQLLLIGQLLANGAGPRMVRGTLFLQGTIIGLVGGVVGVGLAVVVTRFGESLLEELVLGRRIDGFDIRATDLAPVVAIATVAATVAAALPARTATRITVLQALGGRRPVPPYPVRLVVAGVAMVVVGLALLVLAADADVFGSVTAIRTLVGIAGAVLGILGTCALAPGLVGRLEPLAGRLRGTTRLAARSVARQRSRTGAVVAAVAVVAGGAVAASSVWAASTGARSPSAIPDDLVLIDYLRADPGGTGLEPIRPAPAPAHVVAAVLAIVDDGEVIHTRTGHVPGDDGPEPPTVPMVDFGRVHVADGAYLDAWRVPPEVREALGRTGAVAPAWMAASAADDVVRLRIGDPDGTAVRTVEAVIAPWNAPDPLVTEAVAADLGLEIAYGTTIVRASAPIDQGQVSRLRVVDEDFEFNNRAHDREEGMSRYLTISPEPPTLGLGGGTVTSVVVVLATLLTLGVVGLGLALSAAETRDERDVLAVVGARPSTLRRLAGAKAGLLAATGVVLGVPLGYLPVLVVGRSGGASPLTDVAFPWLQVGLLVVVVPLVAAVAALGASAVALRVRPVRASSMAFD